MSAREGEIRFADVNDDIVRSLVETGPRYYVALAIAVLITLTCFVFPWFYQLYYGIGAAGMNHPTVWGTYLASFIFWIGLSHSGTLLSCVLHITNSAWRKAMYRSAEAMTLFSLLVAATMFGVTTPCVQRAREILEQHGFEVLIFHATGNGGQAMESYALAYKFGMLPNVLLTGPFMMIWGPKRFKLASDGEPERTYGRIFTYYLALQILLTVGIAATIAPAIKIVANPRYLEAHQYVLPVLLGYVAYGVYRYTQFGILLKQKTAVLGGFALFCGVINVGLNAWAIPRWGAAGAAWTTVASFILLLVLVTPVAQRFYRIPIEFSSTFNHSPAHWQPRIVILPRSHDRQ